MEWIRGDVGDRIGAISPTTAYPPTRGRLRVLEVSAAAITILPRRCSLAAEKLMLGWSVHRKPTVPIADSTTNITLRLGLTPIRVVPETFPFPFRRSAASPFVEGRAPDQLFVSVGTSMGMSPFAERTLGKLPEQNRIEAPLRRFLPVSCPFPPCPPHIPPTSLLRISPGPVELFAMTAQPARAVAAPETDFPARDGRFPSRL